MAKTIDKNGQMLSSMFNLRSDMASFDEIENTIVSGSKLQGTNAWILMMAILVANWNILFLRFARWNVWVSLP